MSKRDDIIDPPRDAGAPFGLVYSEILGWIDLGHALGRDIKELLELMATGEKGSAPYYEVVYSQAMYKYNHKLGTGVYQLWLVKKGTALHWR